MARRPTRVKNKAAAPIQITAEQILREARERQEPAIRPPKQKITDHSELDDYRSQTRKKFEDQIRRFRSNSSVWVKYAQWEEKQKDFARTRSVWERALEVDYKNHTLWLKYAEFEMKNRFVNSARNVWDKAVSLLPCVDQLWFKYAHMEEVLGNVAAARQVFERWMMWRPDTQAWLSYINFENRYGETKRAQQIYNRFILCHPRPESNFGFEKQDGDKEDEIVAKRRSQYEEEVRKNRMNYDYWFDYIRLEEGVGNRDVNVIREVYERAIANVPPREEKRYWVRYIYLWINYALFEELEAEDFNRTRDVYKKCLELIPHKKFSFAKIWLLAAQFEIRQKNLKTARQILGNAIGKAPKSKIFKRYIDIELQLGNLSRCRILYQKYLEWNPANCCAWIKYAEFERSCSETERARAIYELAIDQTVLDKPKLLWKAFINFEISQNEFEMVRQLYERLLQRTERLNVNRKRAVTDEVGLAPNLKILEASYRWKKQKVGCDED